MFDHFPSMEELRREEARLGIVRPAPAEMAWLRFKRLLRDVVLPGVQKAPVRLTDIMPDSGLLTELPPWFGDLFSQLPSWFGDLFASQWRGDHRALSAQDRQQFNDAIQQAHADGSYQALALVHADMTTHRMHSMAGPVGTQRFLPWHRVYVLRMEELLRSKKPGLSIPYWNYAEEEQRPDWVWQPPQVVRDTPGAGTPSGSLPSWAYVNNLVNNTTAYTDFTSNLEVNAHNDVHNWCNGTISTPETAAKDPIFWLLHSNVDRIWDAWQLTHTGTPTLASIDAQMDPWKETASDANDVLKLGYAYA
jgi:hypothetical protein